MTTPTTPAPMRAREQARDVLNSLSQKPYPGSRAWTEAVDAIAAALLAARREGIAEQIEKDCKQICSWCKHGLGVYDNGNGWYHDVEYGPDNKHAMPCNGGNIRHAAALEALRDKAQAIEKLNHD